MDYNSMSMKDDDYEDGSNNNLSGYASSDNNSSSHTPMTSGHSGGMSKAELRKSNKPIMEKRRRARINRCLNEIKSLILDAMKKDPARHTKLEKADILEMTVKYLQSVQRQQLSLAVQTDPTVIHKFKTGFSECAEEVNRYIGQLEGIEIDVRQRLSNHLNNCVTGLDQIGTFGNFSTGYRTTPAAFSGSAGTQYAQPNPMFPLPQDVNNNGRIQMGGVQLIPSRLPTGELALVMPNSSNIPFFPQNLQTPNIDFATSFPRLSAFTKPNANLLRSNQTTATTTSPPLSPISSISSCDESMHTSADFQSKTPPLQLNQSMSNAFPTPPSAESIKFTTHTRHLQQPHVSSTSELQTMLAQTVKDDLLAGSVGGIGGKKRSHPDERNDNLEEPASKMCKKTKENDQNGNLTTDEESAAESTNDMWRPW